MSEMTLPDLPYAKDALQPYISAETLEFHHNKHQRFYVDVLNEILPEAGFEDEPLTEIIGQTIDDEDEIDIYNYASQLWNTDFYWHCMTPNGGGEPTGELKKQIQSDFGSYETFYEAFKKEGSRQFGNGWIWLVADSHGGKLSIISTDNADSPVVYEKIAVLGCCVWQHAYYLDYRDRCDDYLKMFLDKLVNWEYANIQYKGLESGGET